MLEAKRAVLFWEGTETSGGGPNWMKRSLQRLYLVLRPFMSFTLHPVLCKASSLLFDLLLQPSRLASPRGQKQQSQLEYTEFSETGLKQSFSIFKSMLGVLPQG